MELLGVSDVAAQIDEPEHVVNLACARFATFIPMVRIGRDRWYPPEAVPVLRVIFDQIRVGVPDEHIETVLTKRFPVTRIASQDLSGVTEATPAPTRQEEARSGQMREVFDRYQSTIQNEMIQMRRELAQFVPPPTAPAPPRPGMSLAELVRQDEGDYASYVDPRSYGYTHLADVRREQPSAYAAPRQRPAANQPIMRAVPPVPNLEESEIRATELDFEDGLNDDAKTILTAISRQAAASETAMLRSEVDGIRQDVGQLMDQFRSFSQQLGVYQDVRDRDRDPQPQQPAQRGRGAGSNANGNSQVNSAAQSAAPTRLEVIQNERDMPVAQYNGSHGDSNGNGLLGQLTRRSPRRMGKSLLGVDE